MTTKTTSLPDQNLVSFADRIMLAASEHWLLIFNIIVGLWVLLPWLAPVLMVGGAESVASLIYRIYSALCHQLPERSYFLFGPHLMLPMSDINAVWPFTDFFRLRQFIGTPELGYKVAWSDRMVSFYTPFFGGGLLMAISRWQRRKRLGQQDAPSGWKPMPLFWWILALAPIAIDGFTHMVSDAINFGGGFRDTNAWLAALTNNAFAPTFYADDALGSFNWWMRLFTGLLAGFATVWFTFPYLEEGFVDTVQSIRAKARQYAAGEVTESDITRV